jgi:hypothetical protein
VKRWFYVHCGLRVRSDLCLPELAGGEGTRSGGETDVHVIVEPETLRASDSRTILLNDQRCSFYVPEAGSYEIRGGREIVVRPAAGAAAEIVRLFVLGSAWGVLLHQRDALAMHSAVVDAGGGALAFCGPPSAGKSSTAVWLARRGFPLVCDDLCRVDVPGSGAPRVWPSSRPLKLSLAALGTVGRTASGLQPTLPRDKYQLPWDGVRTAEPLPLRAIYLLEWGEQRLLRLSGVTALRRFVVAATYRPELLGEAEMARHWERCLRIARDVPVWELRRPRDWRAMDHAMAGLTRWLEPTV